MGEKRPHYDELQRIVRRTETLDFGGYTQRDADSVVDSVYNAGYRQQRLVHTHEELNALAETSVVMESDHSIYQCSGDPIGWSTGRYMDRWFWMSVDGSRCETEELDLPVILLYDAATRNELLRIEKLPSEWCKELSMIFDMPGEWGVYGGPPWDTTRMTESEFFIRAAVCAPRISREDTNE